MDLCAITLSSQSRCIVSIEIIINKSLKHLPSNLLITKARRPGSDNTVVTEKLNWNKSSRIVRSNGTQNNECFTASDSGHTELIVHADRCRS